MCYRYIIMAAGLGTRWNNYLGVPKHLITINNETLLGRTTRLLKENGISDYVITCEDPRYMQYGPVSPQTKHDCEIDRYEETLVNGPVCYLYGDVYYSEEAIKKIVNHDPDDVMFFGNDHEIVGIKIKDTDLFFKHKNYVKQLYLTRQIGRCIGWEIYRSMNNLPFDQHIISNRYILFEDETDDIDYPYEYEEFKKRLEG